MNTKELERIIIVAIKTFEGSGLEKQDILKAKSLFNSICDHFFLLDINDFADKASFDYFKEYCLVFNAQIIFYMNSLPWSNPFSEPTIYYGLITILSSMLIGLGCI